MFKFLFKAIVMPVLILVAIVSFFLFMLYKSVTIPSEDFTSEGSVNFTSMTKESIDEFLIDQSEDSSIVLDFSQEKANGLILTELRKQNPSYQLVGASDDLKDYVIKEDYFGYQGTWIRIFDKTIEIESGAHVFISETTTFKSSLLIAFELVADTDKIELKLTKLNIGKMPFAWAFGPANWIIKQATGKDLKSLVEGSLNGMGTFDPKSRTLAIDVDAAVNKGLENDPEKRALVQTLLNFVEVNELIEVGFLDKAASVSLNLGKLRDNTPRFILDPSNKINNDLELQLVLKAKTSGLVFSVLDTSQTSPYVDLDTLTLNRVFDYFLKDSSAEEGIIQRIEFLSDYELVAYMPYVSTVNDLFYVNIPVTITDINNNTKVFKTTIKLNCIPEIDDNDLVFNLNKLEMGNVELTGSDINTILSLLGDNDFIEDGRLVIKDFDQQMNQNGLTIESIETNQNGLRLFVELNTTVDLNDVVDAISDVLDEINNNPDYPDSLNDAIDNALNNLEDPEAIENLILEVDNLTDEEKDQLLADIEAAFENTDLDINDIFGLIPEIN